MTTIVVSDVLRDAVVVAIKLAGPMLLLSMLVGVLIAIFQAVTQIHEQTIAFILKLVVILTVLMISGSWMGATLVDFTQQLFAMIPA